MEEANIRKPQVAGQFYSSSSGRLKKEIELLIDKEAAKREVIACMMPHAGYMYSGKVAGKVASSIKIKERVVLIGPNHTGYGREFGIMTEGTWQMPFGEVAVDAELATQILKRSCCLEEDSLCHAYEHSLEVELPFLQYFKNDFSIVPIALAAGDLEAYKKIGTEIANTIRELNLTQSVLIVASSDMTHYESQKSAEKKDKAAIEAILELNENKLWEKIKSLDISMCGYAAAITMLSAAKLLGAKKSELLSYQTSGDVTGDYASVVGYCGIIVY
jgi:hypothetical protein